MLVCLLLVGCVFGNAGGGFVGTFARIVYRESDSISVCITGTACLSFVAMSCGACRHVL